MSPSCRDIEITSSRAKDNQVVHPFALAKSLVRRGFLVRKLFLPPVVLKEVSPALKGKDPTPEVGSSSVVAVLPSS